MIRPFQKRFKHNLYTEHPVSEHYLTEEKKRFYQIPGGMLVPSVTTVLYSKEDPSLQAWRERVGVDESEKISTKAKNRGIALHSLAEKYLLNDPYYTVKSNPLSVFDFMKIKDHMDNKIDNVRGIEIPLYSRFLRSAGRADCIAEWDGKLAVIDFKTSRKPKKKEWIEKYFLQTTAYSLMIDEMYGEFPSLLVIIIAGEGASSQVFVEPSSDYIDQTQAIFEEFHREREAQNNS